jgi:crossover junction endodeoxyribonuclease RuvC
MQSTVILGIDPGFHITGYSVIKNEQGKSFLLECDYLKMSSSKHLSERAGIFYSFFNEKIKQQGVTQVALETPFLGKNAQTFLKLGYLRGILYLLADQHKLTLHEFAPREVKIAVTGFGGASKEQVAMMILNMFPALNSLGIEKADVTDACAVALCGLWNMRQNALLARLT